MYDILVVIVARGGLMPFAYRGVTLLILAPGLAMLAVLASFERPVLASYTQIFMVPTGDFIVQHFPVFLLGTIFGKLMEDSCSAEVLANATIRRLKQAETCRKSSDDRQSHEKFGSDVNSMMKRCH